MILSLLNYSFFRNIDTIQNFSGILIFNSCCLLNQSSWLWNKFNGISFQDESISLALRYWTNNIWPHPNPSDKLTQEISDFSKVPILLNNHAEGQASIHRSHLIMEVQCNPLIVFCPLPKTVQSRQFLSISPPFVSWSLFIFFLRRPSSPLMWLKSLCRVPRGPFIITRCSFRKMVTFSGTSTVWWLRMVFILTVDGAKRVKLHSWLMFNRRE